MAIQPSNFSFIITSQSATVSNPTLASGTAAGSVFDGKGHDFLDPDKILSDVDGFSGSISPVRSNTLTGQLGLTNPFGRNADPSRILSSTTRNINQIMSPGFGGGLQFTIPVIPLPGNQLVPDLGTNPDPTKITLFTNAFAQGIQPLPTLNDPRNFNPLVWQNPNANNILLGTLGAQGTVLSGGSLNFPPFNPFPTMDSVLFPFQPFQTQPVMAAPQFPQMQPAFPPASQTGFGGAIGWLPVSMQPVQPTLPQSLLPMFPQPQPFSLSTNVPVQSYPSLVGLLTMINDATGLMSHAMRRLVAMDAASPSSFSLQDQATLPVSGWNPFHYGC